MKANEKIMILILSLITIIMFTVFIRTKNKNEEISAEEGLSSSTTQNELIQQREDGTKLSISEKLKKTKTVGDIEIKGIRITENNGTATLTANVKNTSSVTKTEFPIKIKLLNKSGEEIETLGAYVGTIKPGETRGINASINMNISQIYDISIEL